MALVKWVKDDDNNTSRKLLELLQQFDDDMIEGISYIVLEITSKLYLMV